MNLDEQSNEDLYDSIDVLLEEERISKKEAGIFWHYLDVGEENCSKDQMFFVNKVYRILRGARCKKCNQGIPIYEVFETHPNGGFCNRCANEIEKVRAL